MSCIIWLQIICCTYWLSDIIQLPKRSFQTSHHYHKCREATWGHLDKCGCLFDSFCWVGLGKATFNLTGWYLFSGDSPHVVSCITVKDQSSETCRSTSQTDHFTQWGAPLCRYDHPAPALSFFDGPQQQIHSSAVYKAEGRQSETDRIYFYLYVISAMLPSSLVDQSFMLR